jgi:hypothetical protein
MQQLNNMKQQHQQHPTNRGILPPETLNALDLLVDRLNASSGRLPTATANNINSNTSPPPPLPIRALLVGTNEGVGLSRSLGTMMIVMENSTRTDGTAADNSQSNNNSISNNMNEDILGRIETVWATLVSAVPPHIMAAATTAANNASSSNNEVAPTPAHYKQPSHPLLSPLLLGDTVRTVTATYTNCNVIHVHMAPLVITIITLPTANLGAVRNVAIPMLKVILEPVRRIIVRSRWQNNAAAAAGNSGVQQQQHMQQQQQQQNVNNGKIILDNTDPLAGLTGGQKIALLSMTPEQKTQFLIQHQQQILLRQQQLHQQEQSQALALMQQQQQQQMMMLMNQQGQQQGQQQQQQSMMQGGNANNMSYQQYMYPALSDEA